MIMHGMDSLQWPDEALNISFGWTMGAFTHYSC
jgi:hypothetical protein